MSVDVMTCALEGVRVITPPSLFRDHRGQYQEIYNEGLYKEAGIEVDFVQDDISVSYKNVLRGIHGDYETWKLITCLEGTFFLVVLNWQPESPQYRKWEYFVLSEHNRQQVLVPPGFGNGHLALSTRCIFHYKQSTSYAGAEKQFTVKWNDPSLQIPWPVGHPVLSRRDGGGGHPNSAAGP